MIASVVSFFLAHKEGCRYEIRRVMEVIGAIEEGMTKGTVSKIMAKPEKFKSELEHFGICVDGECLVYDRNKRVFFTKPPPPPKTSTGAVIDAEPASEPTSHGTALEAAPEATVSPEAPEKPLPWKDKSKKPLPTFDDNLFHTGQKAKNIRRRKNLSWFGNIGISDWCNRAQVVNSLVVLNGRKWGIKMMQKCFPFLILRRLTESFRMIFQAFPSD